MTFRRFFLVAIAVFLSVLAWTVKDLTTKPAEVLAGIVLWCLVLVLMLPSERLSVGNLLSAFKTWKGRNDERE